MKYQICHSNIWPDHHLLQKNPWEGRAYLETLHDLPGRLSDASSFSSERICSCQGGGFLQPSNYLNALPSIKKISCWKWGKKAALVSSILALFTTKETFWNVT